MGTAAADPLQITRSDPYRGLPAVSADGTNVLLSWVRQGPTCRTRLVRQYNVGGVWGGTYDVRPCEPNSAHTARRNITQLNRLLRAGGYTSLAWTRRRGDKIALPKLALTVRGSSTKLAFDVVHAGTPVTVLPVVVAPGTRVFVTGAAYVPGKEPHMLVRTRVHRYREGKLGPPLESWWPIALPAPAAASHAAADARAAELYQQLCAACHGPKGRGDGPAARVLDPKPRDYTEPLWQKTVTDAYLAKVILEGGMAVGKSPTMPPNPHLRRKPHVVEALIRLIRGFRVSPKP